MLPLRTLSLSAALTFAFLAPAAAWGPDGHSIVAEIAQRRLSPEAAAMVATLLGRGHSLASIASWPDDVREERPETSNWHFVDIPISVTTYNQARDCSLDKKRGDCIILELGRLKDELACGTGDKKVEALKFTVHFLGDIHQPLHTVDEAMGGNEVKVELFMRGETCTGKCEPKRIPSNFHSAWDGDLIKAMVFDWGRYVYRPKAAGCRAPTRTRRASTAARPSSGPTRRMATRRPSGTCARPTTCSTTATCATSCRSSIASSASPGCGWQRS